MDVLLDYMGCIKNLGHNRFEISKLNFIILFYEKFYKAIKIIKAS